MGRYFIAGLGVLFMAMKDAFLWPFREWRIILGLVLCFFLGMGWYFVVGSFISSPAAEIVTFASVFFSIGFYEFIVDLGYEKIEGKSRYDETRFEGDEPYVKD